MNGKFKILPFGFNRREVIEYIKELSSEKGKLSEENQRLSDGLESVRGELEALTALYLVNVRKLDDAGQKLELAVSESARLKAELGGILDAVSSCCAVSDSELLDIAKTLAGISEKLKSCLTPVKEALAGADKAPCTTCTADENI